MAASLEPAVDPVTQQLADGFDALSYEYKELAYRYSQLEKKILTAKERWETLRLSLPDTARKQTMDLDTKTDVSSIPLRNLEACLEQLGDGRRKYTAIKEAQIVRVAMKTRAEKVNNATRPALARVTSAPLQSAERVPLEQDYTTPTTGEQVLDICESCKDMGGCPFGKTKPPGHTQLDEAAAAAQGGAIVDTSRPRKAVSLVAASRNTPPSIAGSAAPVCPIRFLNQHSPEEIAAYFQEHKHELPRSHEICVKRFQTDAESIRELDAKYGSLVNMIQGLGQKHQPMLPQEPKGGSHGESEEDLAMKKKVQNWAAAVSEYQGTDEKEEAVINPEDEQRQSHFDRPLREVRIGESPSRPWGVHVPPHLLERNESMASSLPARAIGVEVDNTERSPTERRPRKSGSSLDHAEKVLANVLANKQRDATGASAQDDQPSPSKCPVNRNISSKEQPTTSTSKPAGKCPIDHKALMKQSSPTQPPQSTAINVTTAPTGKCPFDFLTRTVASPHTVQPAAFEAEKVGSEKDHSRQVETPATSITATIADAQAKPIQPSHPTTTASNAQTRDTTRLIAKAPTADELVAISQLQSHTAQRQVPPSPTLRTFTNRGVAIVHDSKSLINFSNVENLGTMIFGYSNEEAVEVANGLAMGRGDLPREIAKGKK